MYILSFDVESNGLHGDGFAVGAVVLNSTNLAQVDRFTGRVDIRLRFDLDPWVAENVLPYIDDLDLYEGIHELREAFWCWYLPYRQADTFILADFGWPVEARFLAECVDDSPDSRNWHGPYPMHELGTLLLCAGVDPDKTNRREWPADIVPGGEMPILKQHNPLDDAIASAYTAVKAMRLIGMSV